MKRDRDPVHLPRPHLGRLGGPTNHEFPIIFHRICFSDPPQTLSESNIFKCSPPWSDTPAYFIFVCATGSTQDPSKMGVSFEETTLLARGVSPGPPRVSSEPPKASPEFSDDLPRYPQSPPGYHQSLAGPPQSLPGLPRLSSESPRASPESLRSLARPPTWLFLSLFSPSSRPLVIKTSSEVSA